MFAQFFAIRPFSAVCIATACLLTIGCQTLPPIQNTGQQDLVQQAGFAVPLEPGSSVDGEALPMIKPPTEKSMVALPSHRLGPSDIMLIDAVRMAPKAPYVIHSLDVLQIMGAGLPEEAQLIGTYQVQPGGMVDLGPNYGSVNIGGMSLSEARDKIEEHLKRQVAAPTVSLSLLQVTGMQMIQGEHLVTPDGTVILGMYGRVFVAGMTVEEAKAAIEEKLSHDLDDPIVSVSVFGYNSQTFSVVIKGAGFGDQYFEMANTGNDTVFSALQKIRGTQRVSDKNRIYVARPTLPGSGHTQKLPVDLDAIVAGSTDTNWQLFPGDRVVVESDRLIELDSLVQKVTAPFERMFGFSLLGSQTIQNMQRFPGIQTRF